jgi:hypothetical protein
MKNMTNFVRFIRYIITIEDRFFTILNLDALRITM